MNYTRLALTAIAATVVDLVYGFLVYGLLLASQFGRYPAVFRSTDVQAGYMPAMMLGILIGMTAASYIYAKGYEGGNGLQEGFRFGVTVGVFVLGYSTIVTYAILNIGRRLTASMAIAGVVEWMVVGTVIGLVYKPAVRPARRAMSV